MKVMGKKPYVKLAVKIYRRLYRRIERKEAVVAVIGVGYVGLPLLTEIAKAGFTALAVDTDRERLRKISRGISFTPDVPKQTLKALVRAGKIKISSYAELKKADVILICVPTPLSKTREPDISYILQATQAIVREIHPGQLIILESTTYPGTTEEVVLPILSARQRRRKYERWRVGKDYYVGFSPERVDPGNPKFGIANTPKIVSGVTPACRNLVEHFYRQFVEVVVPVSSPRVAEMAKLLENTYRAVNIGLANEVAILCRRMGISVWEVVNAAATKPFGFQPFYPGPGLGGHCIPIDPLYLSYKAKTLKYNPRFLALADAVNQSMPAYVVSRIRDMLSASGIPLKSANILLLGVAYKKDVADTRESPALEILKMLLEKGASVAYHDPYVPSIRIHSERLKRIGEEKEFPYRWLEDYDLVVITTPHSVYDWKQIEERADRIFDLRNAIPFPSPKVEKL